MNSSANQRGIVIVEDSDEDFRAMLRVFKQSQISNPIHRFADGRAALEWLKSIHNPAQRDNRPRLVILDLNLPGMDGSQVLAAIKADPTLRFLPVVIFTSSGSDTDMARCYGLTANSFLTKPLDFADFKNVLKRCVEYWLSINRLPLSN